MRAVPILKCIHQTTNKVSISSTSLVTLDTISSSTTLLVCTGNPTRMYVGQDGIQHSAEALGHGE
jgi:hypothetical protein